MRKRSLAETLVFVSLLFISSLSVRACSGVHVGVRGCFGGVRVPFGLCSGSVRALFGLLVLGNLAYMPKSNTKQGHSVLNQGADRAFWRLIRPPELRIYQAIFYL